MWGDGWILTLGLDMEMHLFNPHTRARLCLPSAQTLPSLDRHIDFDKPEDRAKVRAEVIKRVTLLRSRSNDELMAVLVYNDDMVVAFSRLGDSSWWDSEDFSPARNPVRVVPFGNNAMVVYKNGVVAAFDADSFFDVDQIITPSEGIKYKPEYASDWIEAYCVRSGEDLLALEEDSDLNDPEIGMSTIHYFVFKFDFKTSEWIEVHELGDVALFVGNNAPIALRAPESAPCRPECIYCTESRFQSGLVDEFVGKGMGVFNLVDEPVDVLYEGDGAVNSEFCPPFFYTPKLV